MILSLVLFLNIQYGLAEANNLQQATATKNSDKVPYKIGIILPLSGPQSGLGEYVRSGIDLAYRSLSPEDQLSLNLIYEDDAMVVNRAVSAFYKLTSLNDVNALIVVGSAVGHAISPLAERKNLLLIAVGASDAKIAQNKNFTFLHWVSPEAEAIALVNEIKNRGYKKLAMIIEEQQGAIAVQDAVLKEMEKHTIDAKVYVRAPHITGMTDYRNFVLRSRLKEVDGIIVGLWPETTASFTKYSRLSGIMADFIGLEMFEDESAVKASNGALLGQWYVSADEPNLDFRSLYLRVFNRQPGWGSANGYDTLNLIVSGLKSQAVNNTNVKQDGNQKTLQIAKYLQTLKDYNGACGTYSATGDNRFSLPAAVKIIKADGFYKLH